MPRISNNTANTSYNVINVLPGHERTIERDVILHGAPADGLTPGSVVVPFTGSSPSTSSFQGATSRVEAPTGATRLPIAVLNISPINGYKLNETYKDGDQVPAIYPARGASVNVRVVSNAAISEGQLLTTATNGSGFVIVGNDTNAVGIAREDATTADPSKPTFILMEVL